MKGPLDERNHIAMKKNDFVKQDLSFFVRIFANYRIFTKETRYLLDNIIFIGRSQASDTLAIQTQFIDV